MPLIQIFSELPVIYISFHTLYTSLKHTSITYLIIVLLKYSQPEIMSNKL